MIRKDLVRWIRDDFNNEAEWREIPDFVKFGAFCVPILGPQQMKDFRVLEIMPEFPDLLSRQD